MDIIPNRAESPVRNLLVPARVGRTLLPVAFDPDLDFEDLDFEATV
jgi:hypothetical protein